MESDVERVQRQYGRQAELYAQSVTHSSGETLQLLLSWAAPGPTSRVLDIATGAGFTAFVFAPQVAHVVAYDLTAEMLAQAIQLGEQRDLHNISFVQGMAESLPFPDESFDIVTCRTAPHHFASVRRFLDEARRVVVTGGSVLIADTSTPDVPEIDRWQNRVEKLRDPSHVRNYTPEEWQRLFREAGLTIEQTSTDYRTPLEFSDWVRRSGTNPEVVGELRTMFANPPAGVARAFEITERQGDVHFAWLVAALKGRK